jgi:hypothetical protein
LDRVKVQPPTLPREAEGPPPPETAPLAVEFGNIDRRRSRLLITHLVPFLDRLAGCNESFPALRTGLAGLILAVSLPWENEKAGWHTA